MPSSTSLRTPTQDFARPPCQLAFLRRAYMMALGGLRRIGWGPIHLIADKADSRKHKRPGAAVLSENSLGLQGTTKPPASLPRASSDIRFLLPHPTLPITT